MMYRMVAAYLGAWLDNVEKISGCVLEHGRKVEMWLMLRD